MEVTPKNPGIEPSKYANVAELNFLCYLVFISVDIRATHQFSHETGPSAYLTASLSMLYRNKEYQ